MFLLLLLLLFPPKCPPDQVNSRPKPRCFRVELCFDWIPAI